MMSVGETARAEQAQSGFYNDSQFKSIFTYLHADSQDNPGVLVNVVHFDSVVDLLLSAAKESTECVDEFIVDGART